MQMDTNLKNVYIEILIDDAEVESISSSDNIYSIVLSKASLWPYDSPGVRTEHTYILTPRRIINKPRVPKAYKHQSRKDQMNKHLRTLYIKILKDSWAIKTTADTKNVYVWLDGPNNGFIVLTLTPTV